MNLYVSNLGFSIHDSELRALFEPYGVVSSAKVIMDKVSGKSRGFGFVEMPDEKSAQQAISQVNGAMADGRPVRVNEARPKEGGSGSKNTRW
jgi:RNA recognition motif-containing protein